MIPQQIDLFTVEDPAPDSSGLFVLGEPILNGFYYEERTKRFVSFCNGRRHFEILASKCKGPDWTREWKERIMKERAI
ncbi:hypothetical protein ACX1C1_21625 [Paenibacillus sp. strain BS8-2]